MFKPILKKIKPSKLEELKIKKIVDSFLAIINNNLVNSEAVVGGSFAKGTWLKDQHDIDVFVLFNDDKACSDKLKVAIKKSFKVYTRIHGSRDYFSLKFKNLHFELVPVFKINNTKDARNITDVSPLHINYIKDNTNENLRDEIRLAKYFLKCNNCYGAETFIGGFSGYVTELLIIHYGSFDNFIKSASTWKKGLVIDIGPNNGFVSNQSFPLVVIDPVQPDRNAAAGLRAEKFISFIEICKAYVKKPSVSFFKIKKVNLRKYDLVLKIDPLLGFTDVVGTKILKVYEHINNELNNHGFDVLDSGWFWEKQGVS